MCASLFAKPDDQLMVWGVNVLLQITAVAAIALTVSAFLRRQPAMRHWVLISALILMLISPFTALAVQSAGGSFLSVSLTSTTATPPAELKPASAPEAPRSVGTRSHPATGTIPIPNIEPEPASQAISVADNLADTVEPAPIDHDSTGTTSPVTVTASASNPTATAAASAAPGPLSRDNTGDFAWRSAITGVLILWACGVAFYLARLAWGWWRLQEVLRSAAPNRNAQVAAAFQQVIRDLGVSWIPELLSSQRLVGPVATGVFRPRVIIPADLAKKVTPDELRNILIHETAHIVRRDQVVVWLQNLAAAFFWLHPLAAAVNQRLARAREEVCDNYVLATTDRCAYSRTLLTLATLIKATRPLPGTVGLFTSRWKLEQRVAELLDERRDCHVGLTGRGTALVAALTVAMGAVAVCGTVTLADAPAPADDVASRPAAASETAETAVAETEAAVNSGEWQPGNTSSTLPGLIPAPATIPGVGRWQAMMQPVGGYVKAAVYSPDGKSIAFGDGTYVRIHDADSLELQRVLVGHSGNVRGIAWSPDGKSIVTGADDATVRLWTSEGVPGPVLKEHLAPVRSLTWHPNSQTFASAALDGTIRIWDLDGTEKTVIEGHEAPVNTIEWSPDGKTIAAGDQNRMVRFWSPDGKAGPVLSGHHGAITRVRWSPDGKWLASTSEGLIPTEPGQRPIATVRLWKADGTAARTLHGHARSIHALAWSPDSRQLITAAEDRQVILWEADGSASRRLEQTGFDYGDVFTLDWNKAAGRILAGGRFSVRFFTADGPIGSRDLVRPDGTKLMFADWHPRENKIALAAQDATVHIWSNGFKTERNVDSFPGFIGCVKWSPDGEKLAVNDSSETVRILNPEGETIQEFSGNRGIPRTMAWSPDGKLLAVTRRGGMVDIFNADGEVHSQNIHTGGATDAAFSPDGTQLATSGLDANVRLTQIDSTGKPAKNLGLMQAFDGDVDSIGFSPDGQWIASGHNSSLRFWRPDGTPGAIVPGFDASVMRLDWSPDSKTVVTGGWDSSVLMWNVDGTFVREFPNHAAPCWGISFSPDGKKLATCGWDGVARILDVETGDILEMAIYVAGLEPPAEDQRYHRHQAIAFNRAGQVTSGDLDVLEKRLVYLVEQPSGAFEVLKPSEFFAKAAGAVLAKTP